MPYYGARRINVRLLAASMNDCSTRDPQTSTDYEPTDEAVRCSKALDNGILLAETPIGDCEQDPPSFLRVIGPDHCPVPLYISHTSTILPDEAVEIQQTSLATRTQENQNAQPSSQINATAEPYAIAVLIELSRHAVQHLRNDKSWPPPDVRYDVFLNADLVCSSWLEGTKFQHQLPKDKKMNLEPNRILITGKRVHKYVERPMIVLPCGIDHRGELYASGRRRTGIKDKWAAVGKGLEKYVNDMKYCLKDGKFQSPLAIYLESLATLSITPEIEDLDSSGPQTFAIIDVVISKGKGRLVKPSIYSTDTELLQPIKQENKGFDESIDTTTSKLGKQKKHPPLTTKGAIENPGITLSLVTNSDAFQQANSSKLPKKRGRRARQLHEPAKPSKLRQILPRPSTPEPATQFQISSLSATPDTSQSAFTQTVTTSAFSPSATSTRFSKRKLGMVDIAEDTIDALDSELTEPALCKDSFVTYAEKSNWQTQTSMVGHWRQVKGVKVAEFDVSEIVFATRFVVCPGK
jgi:hypothetical protein